MRLNSVESDEQCQSDSSKTVRSLGWPSVEDPLRILGANRSIHASDEVRGSWLRTSHDQPAGVGSCLL